MAAAARYLDVANHSAPLYGESDNDEAWHRLVAVPLPTDQLEHRGEILRTAEIAHVEIESIASEAAGR